MASRSLEIVVDLKDRASSQLEGMQGKIQDMQPKFRKMATAGTVGFAAVAGAVGKSVQKFGEFEQAEVGFESMLGSAEDATSMMEDLQEFSAGTPFQFKDIADASRTLMSFGSTGEEAQGQLDFLGDIAAGTQVPLGDLSNIFGKVQTKGKAMTEEIMQMSERGIPVIDALAEQFDVSKEEIFEMAEEGELTADVVEEAMRGMTEEGGMFEDQMEKQSKTVAGRFSTLKDNVALAMNAIGDVFDENAKDIMGNVIDVTKSLTTWIEENPKLTKTIVMVAGAISGVVAVLGFLGILVATITPALGFLAAAIAFIATPATLVIAVIAAVAAGLIMLAKNSDKVVDWITEKWESFKEYFTQFGKELKMVVRLIAEAISKKFSEMWESISTTTSDWLNSIFEKIKEKWNGIKDFFGNIWDGIKNIFSSAINGVIGMVEDLINGVIIGINDYITKLNQAAGQMARIPGVSRPPRIDLMTTGVDLPRLAEGGIVTDPTTALIGEAGPEAIIPLDRLQGAGGQTNVNITVNGDVSGEELVRKVKDKIARELNREIRL